MDLRTTFSIPPSKNKISYQTPVIFLGSCFASEIGSMMNTGRLETLINPAGTVYNPVSIAGTIDLLADNRKFEPSDLYIYKGISLSLSHYTDFESEYSSALIDKINKVTTHGHAFLLKARLLFITFGTARVYRLRESGRIVSNCHKLPADLFSVELLEKEEIIRLWKEVLDKIHVLNEDLRIIFTISPVRHWKDGAHGNQISKSVLFLAMEELLNHPAVDGYFPAYELLMDDLRDYRYYSKDMLHPSETAIDYIWNAFAGCYLTPETLSLWREVRGITKALDHRFLTSSAKAKIEFAQGILNKISAIEEKIPGLDLAAEKSYFNHLVSD